MVINALNSGAKTFMADFEVGTDRVPGMAGTDIRAYLGLHLSDLVEHAQWSG